MKTSNRHNRPDAPLGGIIGVAFSILLFTSPSSARAERVLEHYDTDSLCALANLIVKAEIGLPTKVKTLDGDCAVWDVSVISSLQGDVKAGTSIRVTGIGEYRKGADVAGDEKRVQQLSGREVVYLFLVPKDAPGGYAKYRSTDADWKVVPSGVRLVSEKQVYSFSQFWPRGSNSSLGYVAMTGEAFEGAEDSEAEVEAEAEGLSKQALEPIHAERVTGDIPVLSVEAFEDKVKTSLKYVTDLRQKLAGGRLDAEQRKAIQKSRAEVLRKEQAQDDHIAELLEE